MKLLSVDFDYFFPTPAPGQDDWQLYDWGMAESDLYKYMLWDHRAAAFFQAGLPLPTLSGEQVGFWKQFRFTPDAKLWVADSHAMIVDEPVLDQVDEIWSFDAHHDFGYNEGAVGRVLNQNLVTCDTWALSAALTSGPVHVRFPRWQDASQQDYPLTPFLGATHSDLAVYDPAEKLPRFGRVFLCRSAAWVPPWLDHQFISFYEGFVRRGRGDRVVLMEPRDGGTAVREFDQAAAHRLADLEAQLLEVVAGDDSP